MDAHSGLMRISHQNKYLIMKNQVLSIERMLRLKKLGVDTRNASLTWVLYPANIRGDVAPHLTMWRWEQVKDEQKKVCVPAFTLQDIIELLPECVPVNDEQSYDSEAEFFMNKHSCRYVYRDCEGNPLYTGSKEYGNNVLESAYNLLCWCAENGYLKQQ